MSRCDAVAEKKISLVLITMMWD